MLTCAVAILVWNLGWFIVRLRGQRGKSGLPIAPAILATVFVSFRVGAGLPVHWVLALAVAGLDNVVLLPQVAKRLV